MVRDKRVLALIPARGGSKGIRNKNIAPLAGRPLIAYTIAAALESGCCDDVVVSTDSEDIAAAARRHGAEVPFMRPAELARDDSKSEAAVLHALAELAAQGRRYDVLALLQPTSPLRNARDIADSLSLFVDRDLSGLASVRPVAEHPLFMRTVDESGRMDKVLRASSDVRRQDLPAYYVLNGAIYINWTRDVDDDWRGNENEYAYVMDAGRSVDIDGPEDLALVEGIMARGIRKA